MGEATSRNFIAASSPVRHCSYIEAARMEASGPASAARSPKQCQLMPIEGTLLKNPNVADYQETEEDSGFGHSEPA